MTDFTIGLTLAVNGATLTYGYGEGEGPSVEVAGPVYPKEMNLFTRIVNLLEQHRKGSYHKIPECTLEVSQ